MRARRFAHFLRDKAHEVHHVGWIAREFRAEFWILSRDADRARVQVTDSHHDATETHQWRRGKPKFLCAQQRRNYNVAPRLKLAVGFQNDAAAKVVQDQSLVRFSQTKFPWNTCVFDASLRRGAGPAIITADEHHIGMRFGHPSRDGPDAHLRHELNANARMMIGIFEIVNQLGQILDRVNVMMRRWGNQPDPGCGVAHFSNPRINFLAR